MQNSAGKVKHFDHANLGNIFKPMYQSSIVPHLNLAKSYCQGILCSPALTNNSVTIKYTK